MVKLLVSELRKAVIDWLKAADLTLNFLWITKLWIQASSQMVHKVCIARIRDTIIKAYNNKEIKTRMHQWVAEIKMVKEIEVSNSSKMGIKVKSSQWILDK